SYTRGMIVMAVSSLVFSAMSLLVPFTRSISTSIVTAARFTIGIAVIGGLGLLGFTELKPVNKLWLVGRGVFGAASVYLMYFAMVKLGLGMGTILSYTYPVFAALLAPIVIREKLHPDVFAAVAVSFVGIWLVVNPLGSGRGGLGGAPVYQLLALLGGVLSAVAVVAIRKLQATDSPYMIYLAQCVFGMVVIGYPTATSSFAFALPIWLVLAGIGILATVAQLLMTRAYRDVPATEGSLLAFLVPVVNSILGILVFGERMQPLTIAGALVVLAACAYVALRERIMGLFG
ncbi:MAG TPA: DMT family transporter, partial [Spirochaetia bacterium]|nr:DMT family transporter [Spirochaetia bacterium]